MSTSHHFSLWFKAGTLLILISIIGFIILIFIMDDAFETKYMVTSMASYSLLYNYNYSNHDYKNYISQHPNISNIFHKIGNHTTNDNIIYYNPILKDQCRNALIYKENIDSSALLHQFKQYCPPCFKGNPTKDDIVWSREMIDLMLQQNSKIYFKKESIRFPWYGPLLHRDFLAKLNTSIPVPTYYMVAKCASSSILGNLKIGFDKNWSEPTHQTFRLNKIGQSYQIHTDCGFTFVRNPIHRFISGYYTAHKRIYNMHNTLSNVTLLENEIWNEDWKFLYKLKEPDRFVTFVDEMLFNSYKFSLHEPLSHINSIISKSFTVFDGSKLHFIGKVEYFEKHWNVLLDYCEWFQDHVVTRSVIHAMRQWGNKYDETMGEYITILGLNDKRALSPAYFIVASNKTLYDSLVNYFWQDFVCFGYEPNFKVFKKFVQGS